MANNNKKQRLFEVMGKVDSSFKPKLNEEMTQPVEEMAKWGVTRANPKYSHFAVLKGVNPAVDGKIVNGWEYGGYDPAELRQFKKDYFFQDIMNNQINPKLVNIVTAKHLQKNGIDPYDYTNWYKNDKDGFVDQIFTM